MQNSPRRKFNKYTIYQRTNWIVETITLAWDEGNDYYFDSVRGSNTNKYMKVTSLYNQININSSGLF